MAPPPSILIRHQKRRLEQVQSIGRFTDGSLTAYIQSVGGEIERSTLAKYRAGDNAASLGLLDLILGHADEPAEVLNLWAQDYGLRVVPDNDLEADARGLADRGMHIAGVVGELMTQIRDAGGDGLVAEAERRGLLLTVARARRELAELEALLSRGAA